MTIYYQGTEEEGLDTGATARTSNFNATYSRNAMQVPLARSKVAMTDGWFRFAAYQGTTIFAVSDVAFTIYNLAGTAVIRALMITTNSFKIQYWSGAAWVDSGVTGVPGYWNSLNEYVVHVKPGAAGVSSIEVWSDGTRYGAASPALTAFSDVSFWQGSQPRGTCSYSEIIIADENLLLWNVKTAPPTADGTDVDGTGAVGNVNEITLSDATYIEFTTAGQKRSFTAAARTLGRNIKAVSVSGRLMRVDATGPQQAKPYLLISGTRYYGTTFALTTSFLPYNYTWALNPSTGLAWTAADANAATLQSGWEMVA